MCMKKNIFCYNKNNENYQICENCNKKAKYNDKGKIFPLYCCEHRLINMIKIKKYKSVKQL